MTRVRLSRRLWSVMAALLGVILFTADPAAAAPACAVARADAQVDTSGPAAWTVMGPLTQVPPPGIHTPLPAGELSGVHIRLERDACFGTCPDYSVEIGGDGEVAFAGHGFVVFEGDHRHRIPPEAAAALVEAFRAADFWSLNPAYVADVTDNSEYRISLTIGGQTKVVRDYVGRAVGMPAAVSALENEIDRVADTRRWIRGNERTIPSLEAEGWNFRSRAAGQALAGAAADAPEPVVLGLIQRGAPVGASVSRPMQGGRLSALDNAAMNGRLEIMRALIKAGALSQPQARDAALRASVASQRPQVVAEALSYHPDVNARDEEGDTALLRMETGGHPFANADDPCRDDAAIAAVLIKAGADPNVQNREGNTLLHETLDVGIARVLLKAGARLEVRNREGETPLLATYDEDVALALIEAGANLKARSKDGMTVRVHATALKWDRVLTALDRR